jgi:flagellar protein FlaI
LKQLYFLLKNITLGKDLKQRITWRKHKKLIIKDLIHNFIREYLEETMIKPVKTINIVEEYSIGDIITVYIIRMNNELKYVIREPGFNDETIEAITEIYVENPNCMSNECIQNTLTNIENKEVIRIYSEQPLQINYYYRKITSGYGPLYPLILDPFIEEISLSSSDGLVYIINNKYSWYGWMSTNIYLSEYLVDRLVLSIARKMGKHISIAQPVAEGLTPEGLRVSLTYGREVSRKGSSIVIRKKPLYTWTITRLINNKMLTSMIAAYLWLVLEMRGSILIVGGMSSGKTTLLQGLLTLMQPTRRVVTIEDTPEINGSTGLWDPLVERSISIGEGLNISMYDLLKFSLRRRADYIVVGEVRGREARLLIQASRLGHGVLATMHSDDASSAIERLIAPPISIPKNMLSSIWCIVVVENINGFRRVRSVYEVDDKIRLHELMRITGNGLYEPRSVKEIVEKTIRLKNIMGYEELVEELSNRTIFLEKLVSNGIFDLGDLGRELMKYYLSSIEEVVVDTE